MVLAINGIGGFHLASAILAMIFGTWVLVSKKATIVHKRLGYCYLFCMCIMLGSAFMIYELFDGFGIFHSGALISFATIVLGMVPVWRKRPIGTWPYLHFNYMYWSVIGLYAAFFSELFTRIPETPFFGVVGIASGGVILLGWLLLTKKGTDWNREIAAAKGQ